MLNQSGDIKDYLDYSTVLVAVSALVAGGVSGVVMFDAFGGSWLDGLPSPARQCRNCPKVSGLNLALMMLFHHILLALGHVRCSAQIPGFRRDSLASSLFCFLFGRFWLGFTTFYGSSVPYASSGLLRYGLSVLLYVVLLV